MDNYAKIQMKKLFLTLIVAFATAVLLWACSSSNRVVRFPLVGASNTRMLVFEKVELTDTATVLTVRGFNDPEHWIKVSPSIHLVAQNKEYELIGSKGVEPGKELFMPEDGDSCFTLIFEPLPNACSEFDFIDADAKNGWRMYDIDFTGKRNVANPTGLPRELKHTSKEASDTPEYAYTFGETTVNIHLMGYREGCVTDMVFPVNSMFEGQRSIDVEIDPATGTGSVTFMQYGTGCAFPVVNGCGYGQFFIAPNETVDLYVNLAYINQTLQYNYENYKNLAIKGCWTKGSVYDALNNQDSEDVIVLPDSLSIGELIRYDMTADEFTGALIDFYHAVCEHAHAQKSGSWAKEICKADAFNTCLIFLNQDFRRWAERESSVPADYKHDPILPEHYARMFACVDIENPWLLMNYRSEEVAKAAQKMVSGGYDDTLACWGKARDAVEKAYKNELTDAELQTMRSWNNSFYADMCEEILRCTRESIANGSKDLEHVEDISPEALFQAIIAPHKGKVILVDFWNTWCGPCRKAIKEIEPHKTGQLSSDDLVWVYIANGTSPIGTYSNMITGIKGVHYRVSDAQWDYLTSKMFDIDGIPSYVLVKKDGTFSLRNDLRDINKMATVLKEELEKE